MYLQHEAMRARPLGPGLGRSVRLPRVPHVRRAWGTNMDSVPYAVCPFPSKVELRASPRGPRVESRTVLRDGSSFLGSACTASNSGGWGGPALYGGGRKERKKERKEKDKEK